MVALVIEGKKVYEVKVTNVATVSLFWLINR